MKQDSSSKSVLKTIANALKKGMPISALIAGICGCQDEDSSLNIFKKNRNYSEPPVLTFLKS